jgi:hypothetical protein
MEAVHAPRRGLPERAAPRLPRRRFRLGPEGLVLALLAVWTLVPLAILFVRVKGGLHVGAEGRFWLGADFPDVPDQLQYLAWIRQSGDHLLFGNPFEIKHDPRLFLHPVFLASGLLWKAGLPLQLTLVVWRPLTIVLLFVGFTAYVRRLIPGSAWARVAALFLALFFFTPATPAFDWLGIGDATLNFGLLTMALEMFPAGYLHSPVGLVVGLLPLFLLGLERLLDPSRRREGRSAAFYAAAISLAGLLVSWVHPWQGLTLLAMTLGVVAWGRMWDRWRLLIAPVAATVAPIAYYYVLSHFTGSAWETVAGRPIPGYHHWGWWWVLALAPALLAWPGVRGRDLDVQEKLLRLWPLAALLVYVVLRQSWFYHAWVGISLPLAILGVRGWVQLRISRAGRATLLPHWAGAAVIALLTVPGTLFYLQTLRREADAHFLPADEHRALEYLAARPGKGGVMARLPLGTAVPAYAGRNTWAAHPIWTPGWPERAGWADAVISGRLDPPTAQGVVRGTGARFVVSDCAARTDLRPLLGPILAGTRRFGCATVYEIDPRRARSPPGSPAPPGRPSNAARGAVF